MRVKMLILMALPFVVLIGTLAFAIWTAKSGSPRASRLADRFGIVRQADEMERQIGYQAIGIAYNVVLFALLGINFYEVFVRKQSLPLSNIALLAGILTQSIATLVLRWRKTRGDEEYDVYPLWKTLLWVFAFGLGAAAVGMVIIAAVLAV